MAPTTAAKPPIDPEFDDLGDVDADDLTVFFFVFFWLSQPSCRPAQPAAAPGNIKKIDYFLSGPNKTVKQPVPSAVIDRSERIKATNKRFGCSTTY